MWQGKTCIVQRVKFMQPENRYCVFTDVRAFINVGSVNFEAWLGTITVLDGASQAPAATVAIPKAETVERIYNNNKAKKKIMDANNKLTVATSLVEAVNQNAATIAQSLMKDFAELDTNPSDELYKRLDAKCKVTNTIVGVATMQINALKLKNEV